MNAPAPEPKTTRPSARSRMTLIAVLAAALLGGLLWSLQQRDDTPQQDSVAVDQATDEPVAPRRSARGELPPDGPRAASTEVDPAPASAPQSVRQEDAPVGIHAFPPLGTRPQLVGIIVPEDFELPPGFVRHFQSSDDGRRLPPILMFDPVNAPLDEFGQPMDIPSDRIVPPEMAPPGLPIILLEPPETGTSEPASLRSLLRSG
ncbi:MAG: hypothetical protein ACXIUM_02575 [Wenzhouxiangella sp.]